MPFEPSVKPSKGAKTAARGADFDTNVDKVDTRVDNFDTKAANFDMKDIAVNPRGVGSLSTVSQAVTLPS
jgi:hypothetical protein